MTDLKKIMQGVERLCIDAGNAVMAVYLRPVDTVKVCNKPDNTPVTEADIVANNILLEYLPALLPGVPVVSEESPVPDYTIRKHWNRFWLIDPIDGTKEFIKRNGQFTINVALVENGVPILGVVYAPALDTLYSGLKLNPADGGGAWKQTKHERSLIQSRSLRRVAREGGAIRIIGSRAYGIPALPDALTCQFSRVEQRTVGSSLKFCLLAEGAADFYPRYAPTMEWDTAAAQAVLAAAGGKTFDLNLQPLHYNRQSLNNPNFYAVGDKAFDWQCLC